jgi:uncharacterized protein (UPF0212 family)
MAAEAAWVITTVIAAADKAIRIDIVETPKREEREEKLVFCIIGKFGNPECTL